MEIRKPRSQAEIDETRARNLRGQISSDSPSSIGGGQVIRDSSSGRFPGIVRWLAENPQRAGRAILGRAPDVNGEVTMLVDLREVPEGDALYLAEKALRESASDLVQKGILKSEDFRGS